MARHYEWEWIPEAKYLNGIRYNYYRTGPSGPSTGKHISYSDYYFHSGNPFESLQYFRESATGLDIMKTSDKFWDQLKSFESFFGNIAYQSKLSDSSEFIRAILCQYYGKRTENLFSRTVRTDSKLNFIDNEKFVRDHYGTEYRVYSIFNGQDIFFLPDGNVLVIYGRDRSKVYDWEAIGGDNYQFELSEADEPESRVIQAWGTKEFVFSLDKFEAPESNEVSLSWYFSSTHGISNKSIDLTEAPPMYDEYLPFIKGGVEDFLDRYMASKASILILLGPPGTGKTSFIRHLIYTRKLDTCVTFDENVMNSDSYFLDYLTGTKNDLMVIEDADVLLSARESASNKIMSKLLNVSDGLVPLMKKKMIFSTNLNDMHKIDPAIMRPGRCFETVHFRQLSYDEATAVCDRAGLERVLHRDQEYTLTEIFNGKNTQQKTKRIGF